MSSTKRQRHATYGAITFLFLYFYFIYYYYFDYFDNDNNQRRFTHASSKRSDFVP